ncbi:hypothetical protein GQ53DRAFT_146369 [Thozetella sp. PMI_491]|nr:hypothetical protein GQ53DRAFT_146369 [Thozetella sp. PMI_491]
MRQWVTVEGPQGAISSLGHPFASPPKTALFRHPSMSLPGIGVSHVHRDKANPVRAQTHRAQNSSCFSYFVKCLLTDPREGVEGGIRETKPNALCRESLGLGVGRAPLRRNKIESVWMGEKECLACDAVVAGFQLDENKLIHPYIHIDRGPWGSRYLLSRKQTRQLSNLARVPSSDG